MTLMEKVKQYIKASNVPETVAARYVFRVDEVESLLSLDRGGEGTRPQNSL